MNELTQFFFKVVTLSGEKMTLKFNETIKPGTTRVLSGHGLPNPRDSTKKGDLVVKIDVIFPDQLSAAAKEAVTKHLP